MSLRINRLVPLLILTIFAMTPLFSALEIYGLFAGLIKSNSESLTPVYVKVLKDLSFVAMILLATIYYMETRRAPSVIFAFLLLGTVLAVLVLTNFSSLFLVAAGIRWILPVFLIFFLIPFVDEELLRKLARIAGYLFVFAFVMQIFQLFFMSAWFGVSAFGLARRAPGIFLIPNTGAFFAMISMFFAYFHMDKSKLRKLVLILGPLSVFLTMSGTGVIVCMVCAVLVFFGPRYMKLISIMMPILAIPLVQVMLLTMNRGDDYFEKSFGARVEIFKRVLSNSTFFAENFGSYTNSGVLIAKTGADSDQAFIADSMYGAIIGNMGQVGLILFCLFMFLWGFIVFRLKSLELFVFSAIFVLFSATTIITEAFPANLIFAVLTAYYLKKHVKIRSRLFSESSPTPFRLQTDSLRQP